MNFIDFMKKRKKQAPLRHAKKLAKQEQLNKVIGANHMPGSHFRNKARLKRFHWENNQTIGTIYKMMKNNSKFPDADQYFAKYHIYTTGNFRRKIYQQQIALKRGKYNSASMMYYRHDMPQTNEQCVRLNEHLMNYEFSKHPKKFIQYDSESHDIKQVTGVTAQKLISNFKQVNHIKVIHIHPHVMKRGFSSQIHNMDSQIKPMHVKRIAQPNPRRRRLRERNGFQRN